MSRSYKRVPYIRQEKKDYHTLNRRIRHNKLSEIPNGAAYRKDRSGDWEWGYIWTREQAIEDYENIRNSWIRDRYSLEEWLNHWASSAKRK